jgi:hypothetical protein
VVRAATGGFRRIFPPLHHPFTHRVHPAPMEKPSLQDDLMKPATRNLVLAIGLGATGLALAAGGIYVGETDDAPGAALLGFLLMTGLMVLAVKTARRKA